MARLVVLRQSLPDDALARFSWAFPDARFIICDGDRGLAEHLPEVEVLVGGVELSVERVAAAARLRWVQTASVGIEGFLELAAGRPDLEITNSRGVNTTPLAEHALMMMLSFARGMPELSRRQAAKTWLGPSWSTIPKVFELSGARLGLVGFGAIGRAVAIRARAFGMEVWALRRNGAGDEGADRILQPQHLHELAGETDHLMMTAPLTPETARMMDARAFASMRPHAYFYNLGRGALVDHSALVAALDEKRIAGAGLEVVDPEPLPATSPLWSMENVIITAHTAGYSPQLLERTVDFWADQLGRYARGEPLRNPINRTGGY